MEIKTYLRQLDPYRAQLDKSEAATARKQPGKAAADAAGTQGDKVSLSSEGKLRTEAFATALAAPDVRQEKIDSLREQIANGSYQIDVRRISERLLQSEQELIG